ncbi:MAG TPA: molybdopterin molybdotransferase MoeA [Candidatus Methanofastidiosa archaeon]|nr:molybdopterin molybdotransferase MoeA [Candidatus Methanofastidiosa archaeon]
MREFKNLVPYAEALEMTYPYAPTLVREDLPLEASLDRVLAEDQTSPIDSPPFDRAAMDGYAVIAEDTFAVREGACAKLEVIDDITAGEVSEMEVTSGKAVGIMTGAKMPKGANAVVIQELVKRDGSSLEVYTKVPPLKNVSLRGEDVKAGDLVFEMGTRLSPEQLAVLRSLGVRSVGVMRRPKVSVIVTGNEFAKEVADGKIFESNSLMLSKLLESANCDIGHVSVVNDDKDSIISALARAADSDFIMVTGGSSFGKKDMSSIIFEDFVFHGVTTKPGRPLGFVIWEGKPVYVMSGYPVAAFVQFYMFVIPFLEKTMGTRYLRKVKMVMSTDLPSQLGRTEFVRCRIKEGMVEPIRKSGSSMLSSVANADGFVLVDELTEGLNKGDVIEFNCFV